MTNETQIELSEAVVIGTLLAGILPEKEATELSNAVKNSGGLTLFWNQIHCELWRRIDAALADRKVPWAYATLKQVEDVPVSDVLKIMNDHVSGHLIEQVYLPELVAASKDREARRICSDVAGGADLSSNLQKLARINFRSAAAHSQTKSEVANAIIDQWEQAAKTPGKITGIDTGLIDLNKITWGWQPENLIIIGARPSRGKTALLIGFARAAAIDGGVPTLFVTLESSITELTRRLACQMSQSNQMKLRGGEPGDKDIPALVSAFGQINSKPIHFMDCSGQSIGAIQTAVKSFVSNMGIRLVVVDYLQKIKPMQHNEKKTYEVAQASEGLKILAKECGIPVVSAAQLNREPEKSKEKGRAPRLSDLSDSGQIERDADVVGLIHCDAGQYSLIIAKHRDGPVGLVKLHFTPACARFDNAARGDTDIYQPPMADA